jgi:DNA-3-methyladenine glycosylase II
MAKRGDSHEQIDDALRHLRRRAPQLRTTIDAVGPFTLRPQRDRFRMLIRSIVSQQLSVAAARTINARVEQLAGTSRLTAAAVAAISTEALRGAGLSAQKISYVRDLADKIASRELQLARLGKMSDEEVIAALVGVKGIGRWTAHMFLIFSLGRLDVLPEDDFGIRSAMRSVYQLEELPSKQQVRELAEPWRPFATVASWYLWRGLDIGAIARVRSVKEKR